ncbi:hypothetical protein ACFX2I_000115 [Malus domestica]
MSPESISLLLRRFKGSRCRWYEKKKQKKKKQGRGKIPSCRSTVDEDSGAGTNESASGSTLRRFFRLKTKPSSL